MNVTVSLQQSADSSTAVTLARNLNDTDTAFSTFAPAVFNPCDHPGNLVSPHVVETVDFVLCVGVFPVLVTCGVITNVINMAVFAQQGLSNRINVCLFSLALSDIGSLVFLMLSKSYTLVGLVDPVAGQYWQQRHLSLVFGSYLAFVIISNVITAIIALERCLCVLNPLKAAKFFRTKHLKILIAVVAVYLVAVNNVSLQTKYQTLQVTDPHTNSPAFINRLTPFHLRHRAFIDVIARIVSVTLRMLSLIIVILCTVAIILRLKVTAHLATKYSVKHDVSGETGSVLDPDVGDGVLCLRHLHDASCSPDFADSYRARVSGYRVFV